MSVVAHGIDLIGCARVREVMARHGDRFMARVLTEREIEYVNGKRDPVPHVAGRFAAKEAILKALGTGWRGKVSWKDMEIANDPAGQPMVTLSGECANRAEKLRVKRILISITHTREFAQASAIALSCQSESSSD